MSTFKIARPVGTVGKIPVPIVKADEPVSSETPMFSEMPAFLFETPLSTPARKRAKTRKPRTPMGSRTESDKPVYPSKAYITRRYMLLSLLVKIMAFNIIENKKNLTCCGEFEEVRVKEAYWISFAFLVYKDICKREPLLV